MPKKGTKSYSKGSTEIQLLQPRKKKAEKEYAYLYNNIGV